jgi:hypothetical protein
MPASQTVRKTINCPPVLRCHRVPIPGKRGTDGYRHEFADIAKGFALLGATQAALADLFGVDEETIRLWKCVGRAGWHQRYLYRPERRPGSVETPADTSL